MKIFLSGTSFNPSYGGPAFSVSRLALSLANAGCKVGLWAPDGSAFNSSVVVPHPFIQPFNDAAHISLEKFGKPDILHDNGLWMPHNHQLSSFAIAYNIPRVVHVRGMLQPWAVNHKKWKKKFAWFLYQKNDLKYAQCILTTSEQEASTVHSYELGASIRCVPNGVDIQDGFLSEECIANQSHVNDKKVALFLGRIHPVKGLPLLIDAWAEVRPKGWVLKIAGPDEAGHKAEIEKLIRNRNLSDVVSLIGPVAKENKEALYLSTDLFVLPTYTENFGMVIGEALSYGIPVLTTKGAPWSILAEYNCGWWVDISVEGIVEGLRQAVSCNKPVLWEMGSRGRKLIKEHFSWEAVSSKTISIYEEIINIK